MEKNLKKLEQLEKKIRIKFKNKKLLLNAFIHRSFLNEEKSFPLSSNEKLEFLGDSVLSLIVSLYLFKHYPQFHEGEYTDIKSALVRTESLAETAKKLNLGDYLLLSKGEKQSGGFENQSILADCFEALIGAIFLEKGFDRAYQFVYNFLLKNKLDFIIENKLYLSAKTRLQELLQDKYKKLPVYKVLREEGPEHKRLFTVGVFFEGKKLATGKGRSKKIAEEEAARNALEMSSFFGKI